MATLQMLELLAFSLSLLLLLGQAFLTGRGSFHVREPYQSANSSGKQDVLFLTDRFELDAFVRVLTSTGRASAVQVRLDMVPAESADLLEGDRKAKARKNGTRRVVLDTRTDKA